MIRNLLHISSRAAETNASGTAQDAVGKKSGKEGLFKQLFENLQNSGEKADLSGKQPLKKDEIEREGVKDDGKITKKSESESDEKIHQSVSTHSTGKDSEKADQETTVSLKNEITTITEGEREGNQQQSSNIPATESETGNSENDSAGNVLQIDQHGDINPVGDSLPKGGKKIVSGNIQSEQNLAENRKNTIPPNVLDVKNQSEEIVTNTGAPENGKNEKVSIANTTQAEILVENKPSGSKSTGVAKHFASTNISTDRITGTNFKQLNHETAALSSEDQNANTSSVHSEGIPGSNVLSTESKNAGVSAISESSQSTKMPPDLAITPVNNSEILSENAVPVDGNEIRIDTSSSDTEISSGSLVMGQTAAEVLDTGLNATTLQAPQVVKNAEAEVTENVRLNNAKRGPEPIITKEEILKGIVSKPEVFGISSEIKKVLNQKSNNQETRSRLDVDKISMRSDAGERPSVVGADYQQLASSSQPGLDWKWAADTHISRSAKMDESLTFKNFAFENTAIKDVEVADQKSTGFMNLTSITISNISIKRDVLPGLSQLVQSSGTGKNMPESWNKHSFVLDDGSKIQLSSRKLDGVIQLKIGSSTPELNRLLQQHQNEIIDHLKKESTLEIDLQFENPKEESGPGTFDDQKSASQKLSMQRGSNNSTSSSRASEYASGRKIRSFGYNNMEWTA
mgnify:CR=1 FL=1